MIQGIFSGLSHAQAVDRLTDAQTAFGVINSVQDLIGHPQLRRRAMTVNGQSVEVPAAPYRMEWDEPEFRGAPRIGQHRMLPVAAELNATESVRVFLQAHELARYWLDCWHEETH